MNIENGSIFYNIFNDTIIEVVHYPGLHNIREESTWVEIEGVYQKSISNGLMGIFELLSDGYCYIGCV